MLSTTRMLLSFIVFSLASLVLAAPAPGACSGACNVHDPALIRRSSDGMYFRFSTGNKIQIAKASSIAGPWTNVGSVVPAGSSINLAGNQDLWAPDVHQIGSTYYLYYAVSTFGSQSSGIGVATSTTMEAGSWTDHGSVGVTSSSGKPYNAIDPNLVTLSNGAYQLTFGSFWGDIYQVAMPSATSKGDNAATGPLIYDPSGAHSVEGAFMYYRSGYYYLFWSAGQCCGFTSSKPAAGQEYHIKVCRSTSSTSGFKDQAGAACNNGGGTTILASHDNIYAPGGQGILADGSVLYYHYSNTNVGFGDGQTLFGYNTIIWSSSGWPSV